MLTEKMGIKNIIMKRIAVCFIVSLIILLSSCMEQRMVTSMEAFSIATNLIENELKEQGFTLSGSSKERKNELIVLGTSYSRYSGYGSKMGNVLWEYYNYTFEDSSKNEVNYEVKFRVQYAQNVQYIENVEVTNCSASRDFKNICGNYGAIKTAINYLNTNPDIMVYAPINRNY